MSKNEMKNENILVAEKQQVAVESEIEELKDRIRSAAKRLGNITQGVYEAGYDEIAESLRWRFEYSKFAKEYLYEHNICLYTTQSEYIDTDIDEKYLWDVVSSKTEKEILRALKRYARALEKEYAKAKRRVRSELYRNIQRNFQRQYAVEFNEKRFCVFVYTNNDKLSAVIICRSMSRAKTIAREYHMNTAIHTARNSECLVRRVHKIAVKEWEELAKEEKVGLYLEKEFYSADDVETKEGYVDIYKILNMIRR